MGFMKSAINNLLGLNTKKDGASVNSEGPSLEDFLGELPEKLGYDIRFSKIDSDQPGRFFNVEGAEAEEFLGQNTEVLDALSHLSMRVLRRHEGVSNSPASEGNENFRVVFDSAGFREKKVQELKDLAADHKKKVLDNGGRPSYIKALGPSDRKIIHTAIAEMGDVMSESIGKGNFKRIRIKLKEDSPLRKTLKPADADASSDDTQPSNIESGSSGAPRNSQGGGRHRPNQGRGGPRRGGRNRRGGGQQGFRGPRSNGGGSRNTNFDAPENFGNRIEDQPRSNVDYPDDNIGNRLRPGESPIYPAFGSDSRGNSGDSGRGNDF